MLLVSNIPIQLFSQVSDLRGLLYPFGDIKKTTILDSSAEKGMTVFVEYASLAAAAEARECLNGQRYEDHKLKVDFIRLHGTEGQASHSGECCSRDEYPSFQPGRPPMIRHFSDCTGLSQDHRRWHACCSPANHCSYDEPSYPAFSKMFKRPAWSRSNSQNSRYALRP